MAYIERDIQSAFLRMSAEFGAVLVTGPRQVGKTTMLAELAQKEGRGRVYVSLDDLDQQRLARQDPKLFLQMHPPPVTIDEIQYAPELFPYLKTYLDATREKGAFWLTGSQLFKLMQGVRESLAGRVGLLQMGAFSQRELYHTNAALPFDLNRERLAELAKKIAPLSMEALYRRVFNGGMPAVVAEKHSRTDFYASYVGTYLERDVRFVSPIESSLKFFNFITAVAARTAQELNYRSLAQDADIDQQTAKRWLAILETLGIIFFLHPFSHNTLKRTLKTPKLYFFDTGLVVYLTKWESAQSLSIGSMSGAILENYVVAELIKGFKNAGREPFLNYYRDKDGREIDILMQRDGLVFPMEVKRSVSPSPSATRTFRMLAMEYPRRSTGAVLCMADSLSALDSETLIVPISYL
jgi:predicted AAA+ superfamily ATPase